MIPAPCPACADRKRIKELEACITNALRAVDMFHHETQVPDMQRIRDALTSAQVDG